MTDVEVNIEEFRRQLQGDAYLLLGDKCYRILDVSEEHDLAGALKTDFQNALNNLDFAYKRVIEELREQMQEKINEARKEGVRFGLNFSRRLPEDWEFVGVEDGPIIRYKKTIYAKKIKKNERVIEIPTSYSKKFKLKNIILHLNSDMIFTKGYAEGYSPHINDTNDDEEEEDTMPPLCIGDFKGQKYTLPTLTKLVKSLEVINLDSAFSNPATHLAKRIFESNQNKAKNVVWWG